MSADISHTDDLGAQRAPPAKSLAAERFAFVARIAPLLEASGRENPEEAMALAHAVMEACRTYIDAHRPGAQADHAHVQPTGEVIQLAECREELILVAGAGPTPECRGFRLFASDPWAACLYNAGGVLNRAVSDLVVLRWLALLQGDPCPRNELVEKLQRTFTIEKPRSFYLRLGDLLDIDYIYWDKEKRGHNPLLTITPNGSSFCSQLVGREVKRLSRDQHNCLATHLPWMGLKPITNEKSEDSKVLDR